VRKKTLQSRNWIVTIPREFCVQKQFLLPSTSRDEIRQMLNFEIMEAIPLQDEEICYDYQTLSEDEEGQSEVLVYLTPKSRLEQAVEFLGQTQIVPSVVMPSSLALSRWLEQTIVPLNGDTPGGVLFIGADHQRCHVITAINGRLKTSRELSFNCDEPVDFVHILTEAEQQHGRFEEDSSIPPIDHIYLTGDDEIIRELAGQMSGIRHAAEHEDPRETILQPEVRMASVDTSMTEEPLSIVTALCSWGAVLDQRDTKAASAFNMAPSSWFAGMRRRQLWLQRGVLAGMVLLILLVLQAFLVLRNYRLENKRDAIASQIEPIQEVANDLEFKKRQARLIQSHLAQRQLPLGILHELCARMPKDVFISHISMVLDMNKSELIIKGPADNLPAAFALPTVLEESPLFKEVRPEGAQQISRGRGKLIEYSCRCLIDTSQSIHKGGVR